MCFYPLYYRRPMVPRPALSLYLLRTLAYTNNHLWPNAFLAAAAYQHSKNLAVSNRSSVLII